MEKVTVKTQELASHVLYQNRPDLWAVTRVLRHCKEGHMEEIRAFCWDKLTEEERTILRDVANNQVPASFANKKL